MNKYRASIILACHNKEKFLEKSIDSLINLSLFNEMEIIIVDDHSCDNSVAIIKEYQEKYSNIKLIELEFGSGGPSKPRNIGIEMAQARYVIFMDPDDVVINDGYSLLVEKIEELNSDILIATRIGVNSQGKEVWKDYIDYYPYINENNREIQKDLFSRRPFILKSIYSKDLILKNNIRFNEKISTSEDECFGMECVYYAKRITKINDIVYQYTVEASG